MTGVRGVRPVLSARPGPARAALPALLVTALLLASCGTIPPQASGGGTVPSADAATTPPSTVAASASSGAASPSSPAPSATPPTKTQPTKTQATKTQPPKTQPPKTQATKPTKAAATPPPDTWVGHFKGKQVFVARGHGATVSFTFDDGPWPTSTSQVLALLEQHHVHAVFCLIGTQARTYPSLVRSEVAGGHALCNHSRDHDLTMNKKGKKYIYAEVADGLADIRRAAPAGTPVRYYRQPGGLWSPTVVKAMNKHDLDPLRWSDDPTDWSRPGSAAIVRRVVSHLHPGVVILMHDGGGDRSQSVEALRFLLDAVVAAGWKPVLAPHVKLSAAAAATPQ